MDRLGLCISVFCICIQAFVGNPASAQLLSSWNRNLELYQQHKGSQGLYLHLDKTNYVDGENIWFTAYQLSDIDTGENTLFVLLQQDGKDSIIRSGKYIMQNGIGKGYLFVDQAIPEGYYRLLAYTNVQYRYLQKPVFQQRIKITRNAPGHFALLRANLTEVPDTMGNYHLAFNAIDAQNGLPAEGKIDIELNSGLKKAKESITISASGSFAVRIPASMAAGEIHIKGLFKNGTDKEEINLSIPAVKDSLWLNWYPEGGNLVADHKTRLAFELLSTSGSHAGVEGRIEENGKLLSRFRTSDKGLGYIDLNPLAGAHYTLHLDNGKTVSQTFPVILPEGPGLYLNSGRVTDSITGIIYPDKEQKGLYLVLHNYRKVFASHRLEPGQNHYRFALPAKDLPPGVLTLTLLNNAMDPIAERAVYSSAARQLKVSLVPDSMVYHTRSPVTLRIKISDVNGNPVEGFFSLASVLSSRYDSNQVTALPAFFYAGQYMDNAATLPLSTSDLAPDPDLVLLIRFWTRYRWPDVAQYSNAAAPGGLSRGVGITLYYKDQPVADSTVLLLTSDSIRSFLNLSQGLVKTIPYDKLYTAPDAEIGLWPLPDKRHKEIRNFRMVSDVGQSDSVNSVIAKNTGWQHLFKAVVPELPPLSVRQSVLLKEVKIVSRKKNDEYDGVGTFRSIDCNDYVCMNNVLNCTNHPYGPHTKPTRGKKYLNVPYYGFSMREVVYLGCVQENVQEEDVHFLAKIKGVWRAKEFYVPDYNKFNPADPENYSTTFWSYGILTNKKGEASVQFFTNDLLGNNTIHLQGFSKGGPITGKAFYKVIR